MDQGLQVVDHERIDALERLALARPECLLFPGYVHRFVPGLYLREIIMPEVPGGYIHTTRIHTTENAYVVLSGEAWVYSSEGAMLVKAPHVGVTLPGTRRVLWNFVECHWMTLHPLTAEEEEMRREGRTDELIERVERRVTEWRELDDGKTSYELFRAALAAMKAAPETKEVTA